MINRHTSNHPATQTRGLCAQRSAKNSFNTWKWLHANDDRDERIENGLRLILVACLFSAVTICGLRTHGPANPALDFQASSAVFGNLPAAVEKNAATAIKTALPRTSIALPGTSQF